MVPRNHNVTLLVLVPQASFDGTAAKLELVAKTNFRDATESYTLPSRPTYQAYQDARSILRGYGGFGNPSNENLDKLLHTSQLNHYPEFKKTVQDMQRNFPYVTSLWVDFLSLRLGSSYTRDSISMAKPDSPSLIAQTPLVFDDGKSTSTVVLRGGTNLASYDQLLPQLVVEDPASNTWLYTFLPDSSKLLDRGNTLLLTYPSLSAWGLDTDAAKANALSIKIPELSWTQHGRYLKKPSAASSGTPLVAMRVTSSNVVADKNGKGVLDVYFQPAKKVPANTLLLLGVEGADAASATAPSVVIAPHAETGMWAITATGTVSLQLHNLDVAQDLILTGYSKTGTSVPKAEGTPIRLPVIRRGS
jgi:hypothetical protein